ncbi:hypothetical protein Tco_0759332 [Tanacetum coccineum]
MYPVGGRFVGLESVSIRRIQGVGYGVLRFLGVGTTFDIFQNIHILYLPYDVLVFTGYGVLIMWSSWSLVSAGTDTLTQPNTSRNRKIVGIKRHMSVVEVTAANMEVTIVGYVSTADEDCRKYSKSLLLLE